MSEIKLSYTPVILRSLMEIMAAFNVGRETVLEWVSRGAPICVEKSGGQPRYSCEAAALQAWRLKEYQKNR